MIPDLGETLELIDKKAYLDDSILALEVEKLFTSGFQFAALMSELANHRDFVCVDFRGCSVVVQNFNGQLRAFENVCTHRFNILQCEPRGNRPLTCRYHGWSFDAEGRPLGNRTERLIAPMVEEALALKRFRVERCGKFVFFAPESVTHGLAEQLGGCFDMLEQLSEYLGSEVFFGHVVHAANWKLLVENVLECVHCAVVHPETFVAGLGVGRKPIEQVRFYRDHSSCHFPRTEIEQEQLRKQFLSHLSQRPFAHDSFFHAHVFPNLFIASGEGASFYIGHALPLAADKTNLRVRFFDTKVALSEQHQSRQRVINEQSIALGQRVIEEDRTIVEQVQRGIGLTAKPGALDKEEVRIAHFMRRYAASMRG